MKNINNIIGTVGTTTFAILTTLHLYDYLTQNTKVKETVKQIANKSKAKFYKTFNK